MPGDAMTAEQQPKDLFDPISRPTAGFGLGQSESAQEEFWQDRMRSLEQWICELLIKNQQLRMSISRDI
jgi:hypothetical protein